MSVLDKKNGCNYAIVAIMRVANRRCIAYLNTLSVSGTNFQVANTQ